MKKSYQVATLGMFTALIILLQLMSYSIKVGTFNLSLVLIPIVVGGVQYGPKAGAMLGAVFGVVVTVCCIVGLDAGGAMLWAINPFTTALVCIVKGTAAGLAVGFIGTALKKKNHLYLACIVSAVCAPVINTGLFCAGMLIFFNDTLIAWANGANVLSYIFLGLVGVNFIIELAVNVVFSPAVTRVMKAIWKN